MSKPLSAEEVIEALGLEALEGEGGYFRRSWTSPESAEGRCFGSAIYYLVTDGALGFSAFHRLRTDELYHFYRGDPVELHIFLENGDYDRMILGPSFELGQIPQALVPAGSAQASRLVAGGRWALLGTTMAPAFRPEDFTLIPQAELRALHPSQSRIIDELTRG